MSKNKLPLGMSGLVVSIGILTSLAARGDDKRHGSAATAAIEAPANSASAEGGAAARTSARPAGPRMATNQISDVSAETGRSSAMRHYDGIPDPSGCPDRFDEEGVYVWCDSDGTWTVSWRSRETRDLLVRIQSETEIAAVPAGCHAGNISQPGPRAITIANDPQSKAGVAQFRLGGGLTTFDLLINGKPGFSKVYLGGTRDNPKSNPFAVRAPTKTNALEHEEISQGERDAVDTRPAALPVSRGADIAPAVTSTSGESGGGGGHKRH